MKLISSIDLNERGDADFDSLSEIEMDLYVLLLFTTLHEMEGMTHFYSHQLHHLPRLLAFVNSIDAPNRQTIHDITEHIRLIAGGSLDVDAYFDNRNDDDKIRLNYLDDDYYSKVPEMWDSARKYLLQAYNAEFN